MFCLVLLFLETILAQKLVPININLYSNNQLIKVPPIYWQSCGFTPASDILTPNGTENMWWAGLTPKQGIHYVRIHYLIDLITVISQNTSTSLIYNFTKLDTAMNILRDNNKYPIFELMGNPSNFFNDFTNNTQLFIWKNLISQIAQRYLNIYGKAIVYQWLFETWNEPPGIYTHVYIL